MKNFLKKWLHQHPRLYTFLYRLVFIASPARLFRKIFYQTRYFGHRKQTVVLAGPGYLGYHGGVYNPGAVHKENGGALLLAKAQVCHWWDSVGVHADKYYKGDPILFTLDKNLEVENSRIIQLADDFPGDKNVGFEDFRMFKKGEDIWVNHGMISLLRKHSCASTYVGATPCLSRLDTVSDRLIFLGFPQVDFQQGKVEKNWMFFESEDDLYLLYSISPFRLLKLADRDSLKFETIINKDFGRSLHDIGGFGSLVSLGTNPIDYDKNHLMLLVHQINRRGIERFYHHWGILLEKSSLTPTKMTASPLFSGMGARGRRAGIVYVSSVLKTGDEFVFFMGEGDAYVTCRSMTQTDIDSEWVDIE